jgi:phage tail-like protein
LYPRLTSCLSGQGQEERAMPINTGSPKAAYRYDPYRNFRFRLKWDGRYVAGVSKVSGLATKTPVVTRRAGGDAATPRRMPGQSEFAPVTLERGVTHDRAFEQWANKVWDLHTSTSEDRQGGAGNQDVSLKDFRKDIIVEMYNEAGQKVLAYAIYQCWPSEFTAMPELDANGSAVAIALLRLENEGWERDTSVVAPEGSSFVLPAS